MNGVAVIVVAAVVLAAGYLVYGRWLAKSWGVDNAQLTPARRMMDGKNFSPASCFTAFSHQFSSICGAGPVTGTIVAMMFGWLPVMLWVLVGGIFFGAVHDFGALYASMKNNGKSLAQLIDKYIGRTGRRLFLLFSWLFCIIVIAAFTDMVAGTFKTVVDATSGAVDYAKSYAGGTAGTISMLFTFVAIAFGWGCRKWNLTGAKEFALAVVLMVVMFAVGMQFPVYLDKMGWFAVIMVYLVFAAAMPIQTLKQPRDYLTSIMMLVMIACAVVGIVVLGAAGKATMTAPMIVDGDTLAALSASGKNVFPLLFVSVACGALSGFHSLVSSGTSSKQVEKESDALPVGYGAMVLESFVGILAVVIAGIMFSDLNTAGTGALNNGVAATPFQIFSQGIARGMTSFGVDATVATVFMTMCVSALALTSLDAVARIGRMSFQELFSVDDMEHAEGWRKLFCNTYFSTIITLAFGFLLTQVGYANIWPLFGSANQLLSALVLVTLCVFLKVTGRNNKMLFPPLIIMLCVTFTALVQRLIAMVKAIQTAASTTIPAGETTWGAVFIANGLQLIIAILLIVLGITIVVNSFKSYAKSEKNSEKASA